MFSSSSPSAAASASRSRSRADLLSHSLSHADIKSALPMLSYSSSVNSLRFDHAAAASSSAASVSSVCHSPLCRFPSVFPSNFCLFHGSSNSFLQPIRIVQRQKSMKKLRKQQANNATRKESTKKMETQRQGKNSEPAPAAGSSAFAAAVAVPPVNSSEFHHSALFSPDFSDSASAHPRSLRTFASLINDSPVPISLAPALAQPHAVSAVIEEEKSAINNESDQFSPSPSHTHSESVDSASARLPVFPSTRSSLTGDSVFPEKGRIHRSNSIVSTLPGLSAISSSMPTLNKRNSLITAGAGTGTTNAGTGAGSQSESAAAPASVNRPSLSLSTSSVSISVPSSTLQFPSRLSNSHPRSSITVSPSNFGQSAAAFSLFSPNSAQFNQAAASENSDFHTSDSDAVTASALAAVHRQRAYRAALLDQARQKSNKPAPLSIHRKSGLNSFLQRRPSEVSLYRSNILKSSVSSAPFSNSQNSLKSFLARRPSALELQQKNILISESAAERAGKLDSMIKARLSQTELERKNILKQPGVQSVNSLQNRRASELSSLLSHRPTFDSLLQKHIIVNEDRDRNQPAAISDESFDEKTSASKLVNSRNTLKDIKSMTRNLLRSTVNSQQTETEENDERELSAMSEENSHNPDTNGVGISLDAVNAAMLKVDKILSNSRQQQRDAINKNSTHEPGGVYLLGSNNEFGQLGFGAGNEILSHPTLLTSLLRDIVVQVAAGANHSLARTASGALFVWGANEFGQLGLGDFHDRNQPFNIKYRDSPLFKKNIQFIAAGQHNSACLTDEMECFIWGSANHGLLGIGDSADSLSSQSLSLNSKSVNCASKPISIPDFKFERIQRISFGFDHVAALNSSGLMFTWGAGVFGQLGHSDCLSHHRPKIVRQYDEFWQEISCGRHFTLSLAFDGNVYAFGANKFGQLGFHPLQQQNVPKLVMALWRKGIAKIRAGEKQSIAITEEGELFATKVIEQQDHQHQHQHQNQQHHHSHPTHLSHAGQPQHPQSQSHHHSPIPHSHTQSHSTSQSQSQNHSHTHSHSPSSVSVSVSAPDSDVLHAKFHRLLPRIPFNDVAINSSAGELFAANAGGEIYRWNAIDRPGEIIHFSAAAQSQSLKFVSLEAISCGDSHLLLIGSLPPGTRESSKIIEQEKKNFERQNRKE